MAFTFDDFIGVRRLSLRQYELECLENYKIYNQYRDTTATSVPSTRYYREVDRQPRDVTMNSVPITAGVAAVTAGLL